MSGLILTIPDWDGVKTVNLLGREQSNLPKPYENTPKNLHVLARGKLKLPPGNWVLRFWAKDHYMLWLDGEYLGQGPVPSEPSCAYYDSYHISGGQEFTVALHLYYQGLCNRVWNSGDGRFGFWMTARNGDREVTIPQGNWHCMVCTAYSGETVGYDTQFLENFDSRLYPEGWNRRDFDDTGWDHPICAGWAPEKLLPRPVKMLEEYDLSPVSTIPIPGGVLLDFGREITGTLLLNVKGFREAKVTLRFGEELEKGRVRYDMRCNCRYEEIWTLSGGENRLHQYDYKAFRYAELIYPDGVVPTFFAARVRHYPMDEGCSLRCETDRLGEIFEICKNAVRCCTQEAFLDCPSREKGQYLGDAIITARSQVWLTGSTEMLRKCIRDFIAYQTISPALMAVAPGSLMQEIADFSLLFPELVMMDYDFTGDKAFLREGCEAVKTMVEAFRAYCREDGLLENVTELWNLVDWPENLRDGYDFPLTRPAVGRGCHNVVNALWYGANKRKAEMETILGLPVSQDYETIAAAFHRAFYRQEERLFADSEVSRHCSVHANLYPAFFGLLPKEAEESYIRLLQMPDRVCGAVPTFFALRSLARLGRQDVLYRLLTREDAYGWKNMLREGATAAFEAWGKAQKWNTSLCHAWNSGPVSLFIEEMAGARPVAGELNFAPPQLAENQHFTLTFFWKGRKMRIKQGNGGTSYMERM